MQIRAGPRQIHRHHHACHYLYHHAAATPRRPQSAHSTQRSPTRSAQQTPHGCTRGQSARHPARAVGSLHLPRSKAPRAHRSRGRTPPRQIQRRARRAPHPGSDPAPHAGLRHAQPPPRRRGSPPPPRRGRHPAEPARGHETVPPHPRRAQSAPPRTPPSQRSSAPHRSVPQSWRSFQPRALPLRGALPAVPGRVRIRRGRRRSPRSVPRGRCARARRRWTARCARALRTRAGSTRPSGRR